MSFSRSPITRRLLSIIAIAGALFAVPPVQAHDESEFQLLYAPFACGTEWSATSGAHHSHPWNLDFNRTSLDYGEDRQHDLGQPLFAQGNGTVVRVDVHGNAGTYVEIDYGDYTVIYVHLVHDSPPEGIVDGATVTTGQFIGLLGDTGNATGFAHLHIEYFDSRGFDDAERWELKSAGQPQTEVTFSGNPVDPYEVIVSNNCVGEAAGLPDPADGELGMLSSPSARLPYLIERLQESTEALDDSTEADAFLHEHETGVDVFARIPGGDLAHETILISTPYTSPHDCSQPTDADDASEPPGDSPETECPGATEHAAGTALVLALADSLAAAETPPNRTVLFAFWDEHDTVGGAAETWYRDEGNPVIDTLVAIVDIGVQGSNATLPLRRTTTASSFGWMWPGLVEAFAGHDTPELSIFGTGVLHPARAGQLADGTVPTVSFSDAPGPCIGTVGDGVDAVDQAKLTAQVAAITAFVSALADGPGATPETTDRHLDGSVLLSVIERTGYDAPAYDHLADAVATPDEPIGTSLDDASERLRSDLATEPCEHHRAPAPFLDIEPDSYALPDVGLLHDLGITTGTGPDTYAPDDRVTREQMAAFLGRLWRHLHPGAVPTTTMPFDDVEPTSFAHDDVRLLVELAITTGSGPDTYAPDDHVTREQMAAFLARLWRAHVPDHEPEAVPEHPFEDVEADSFAFDDISLIRALAITTGTGPDTYAPDDHVTREQMAAFLARLLRATDT